MLWVLLVKGQNDSFGESNSLGKHPIVCLDTETVLILLYQKFCCGIFLFVGTILSAYIRELWDNIFKKF